MEMLFPIWTFHLPQYNIYALPIHGNTGTKIGVDAGGHVVTADTRTFNSDPVRVKSCTDLLNDICPKFVGPILQTKTCLYTMTETSWSTHAHTRAGLTSLYAAELDMRTSLPAFLVRS